MLIFVTAIAHILAVDTECHWCEYLLHPCNLIPWFVCICQNLCSRSRNCYYYSTYDLNYCNIEYVPNNYSCNLLPISMVLIIFIIEAVIALIFAIGIERLLM